MSPRVLKCNPGLPSIGQVLKSINMIGKWSVCFAAPPQDRSKGAPELPRDAHEVIKAHVADPHSPGILAVGAIPLNAPSLFGERDWR